MEGIFSHWNSRSRERIEIGIDPLQDLVEMGHGNICLVDGVAPRRTLISRVIASMRFRRGFRRQRFVM